ncbi:MAG: beta strand repeat-containing protein [Chthoniobacterales bacterium]
MKTSSFFKKNKATTLRLSLAFSFYFTAFFQQAQAASVDWDGDAADGVFSNGINWVGDTYPGSSNYGVLGNGDTATSSTNASIGGMHVSDGTLAVDSNSDFNFTDSAVDFLVGTTGSGAAEMVIDDANFWLSSVGGMYLADASKMGSDTTATLTMNGASGSSYGNLRSGGEAIFGKGSGGNTGVATLTLTGGGSQTEGYLNLLEATFGTGTGGEANVSATDGFTISITNDGYAVVGDDSGSATMDLDYSYFDVSTATVGPLSGASIIIGRSGGTGEINLINESRINQQGSGVADLFIGDGTGSSGTVNASSNSFVGSTRDILVGTNGGTGTITASGAGTNFTAERNIEIGTNGGTGTATTSETANLNAQQDVLVGAGAGSDGTLNITEDSAVFGRDVIIGSDSGTGLVNLIGVNDSDSANITVSRNVVIGDNGSGTVNIGTVGSPTIFALTGEVQVGVGSTGVGVLSITSDNTGFTPDVKTADMRIGLDSGSQGTVTVTNAGFIDVDNDIILSEGGTASLSVTNNAYVTTGSIQEGAGDAGSLNFNDGRIYANRDESDFFAGFEVSDITVDALTEVAFSTNGNNVGITQHLDLEGSFIKEGAGTLTTVGGTIGEQAVVLQGTWAITDTLQALLTGIVSGATFDSSAITEHVVDAGSMLAAVHLPGFPPNISYVEGNITTAASSSVVALNLEHAFIDSAQKNELRIQNGELDASNGGTFGFDLFATDSDQIFAQNLNLDNDITIDFYGASTTDYLVGTPYTLMYGDSSGTWLAGGALNFVFQNIPDGYSLDPGYGGGTGYIYDPIGQTFTVQFGVIPEPSSALLLLAGLGLAGLTRKFPL